VLWTFPSPQRRCCDGPEPRSTVAEGHGLCLLLRNNGEESFDSISDGRPPARGWCRWKELGGQGLAFCFYPLLTAGDFLFWELL